MNKLFFALIFGILMIGLASATSDTYGITLVNANFSILQSCTNCTFSNITSIVYPNGTTMFANLSMIAQGGGSFAYYFVPDQLGWFYFNGLGDFGTWGPVSLQVTQTGTQFQTPDAMLYIFLIIVSFVFFGFFLYWSIRFKYSNEMSPKGEVIKVTRTKYLKILAIWFSVATFFVSISLLAGLVNNFSFLSATKTMITSFYLVFQILVYVSTVFLAILMLVEFLRDLIFNKEIRKFGSALINHG